MDILYTGKVDGFCIISSDSDFTKLATRLRESGMKVFGFGQKKTPNPFIVACDKFIYIEILKSTETNHDEISTAENEPKITSKNDAVDSIEKIDSEIVSLISSTVDDLADEDGWAFLGEVGNLIIKKRPDFDARNYGFDKLSKLIKSLSDNFEIDERTTDKATIKLVYIRIKK